MRLCRSAGDAAAQMKKTMESRENRMEHKEEKSKMGEEMNDKQNMSEKNTKEPVDFRQYYFLQNYLYSGDEELLKQAQEAIDIKEWDLWHCAVLLETEQSFFDTEQPFACEELQAELRRPFYYLNLNSRQALLLFYDEKCDYTLVIHQLYIILKRSYMARMYLAVSRVFDGYRQLPQILRELEQQLEEKFYHPEEHVFVSTEEAEQPVNEESQDSQLIEKISEDISRKDVELLWKHYGCLEAKYGSGSQFSGMYVKFVFTNVIQELMQESCFAKRYALEEEIDRIYGCSSNLEVLAVTRRNIQEFTNFLNNSMNESRREMDVVKNHIRKHCGEELDFAGIADRVHLCQGYLNYIFLKETRMDLNRFQHVARMEKARELLQAGDLNAAEVSSRVGFRHAAYFGRCYREYFGCNP